MLNAGWQITFDVSYDEHGTPTTNIHLTGADFVVDENGEGAFEPYTTNMPNVASPYPVVA